ncbi:hypothetical protein [Streptomyces sp. CBMA29]|uniref:hypothetical protein n=1 Tax=Streptomyces sp. CBMA29 TaxID=1896314 RepID=UPI001661DA33|nr:hypothetical protein [Streptomyces sp. CBMA29]
MPDPKIDQALSIAQELVTESAPALVPLSRAVSRLCAVVGVSAATARKRIRAVIRNGDLYELKPDVRWRAVIPGAEAAGITDANLLYQKGQWRIAVNTRTPSDYFPKPGTAFIMTPERAVELIDEWTAARPEEAPPTN